MSFGSHREIKRVEQWKWAEIQGLELIVTPHKVSPPATSSSLSPMEELGATSGDHSAAGDGSGDHSQGQNLGNEVKEEEKAPSFPFFKLFAFADGLDYVLMGLGTVGAIVHGSSLPVFLRFFSSLVNSFGSNTGNPDKMMQEVLKYAFDFLIVGAAIWASSWAEISCWMWTGERQSAKLRIKYLEATLNQDIEYFDTDARAGDIINTISCDIVAVQDAISERLGNFIHYMATFVSGFVVGFTTAWQLALLTLAVVPLIAIFGAVYTVTLTKLSSKSQDAHAEAGKIAEQTLAQIRTVFSFVGEEKAMQGYSAALKVAQKIGYRSGLVKGFGLGATFCVIFCCYALLLWYGGLLVRHHDTNGGLAISTIFSVMIGGLALGQAAPSMTAFAKAKSAAVNIFQTIEHRPKIDRNHSTGATLPTVSGQVELRNVSFSYPSRPEMPILSGFSLNIPAGKTVAMVGRSGSGKSTVVALIERFYDPIAGDVLLDGHNIKTLQLKWLRQQIGLVSQEPALFATSIKENMLLGREDATQVEMEEAARVSNAHSFITKLPDGYDTQVGERGVQLSGGQKQRIAIARAMLKNPAILLLDEATSALDAESEKLVQEALDRFMIGRTTVVVAHRLSTIRKADLVAVVQQGSILEMGTHDELISKGEDGAYAALIKLQENANEYGGNNPRKSSARPSSARNSVSSPIIGRNSSYGRSPYSKRLSDFSTSDFSTSVEANMAYKMEKVPFKEQAGSFWRLVKMNAPEWGYALIGSVGSMACGSISALFAYILSAVLSIYYNPDPSYIKNEIRKYCYILIGISFAALVFNTLQHSFWEIVGENLTKRVREKMFAAILRNEVSWFDLEENNSSQVAARLASDSGNVRSAIGDRISMIVQNTALMLVACTIGFVLQWRLALVLIAVFPVVVAATLLQKMFMKGFGGDLEGNHAKATMIAGEAVGNVRTVQAFNSERKIVELLKAKLDAPLKKCFWKGQIAGSGFGLAQFLLYASYGIGLWYASWLVKHQLSDFGKVIRVFMVLMVSANGAAETLTIAPDIVKGGRAIRSVFQLLDRKTEIEPDDPEAVKATTLKGDIDLKHVEFCYPSRPDVQVFRDLTLKVRPGKSLALVGASGSGKSSVIALIQRFYDPVGGRILIDGKDIRKYNLQSLRRHIGLVQQEPALFAATIFDNIVYGREGATETEVIAAADAANAHKFICSLPDGYRTKVGERGVQLSGGQKQRVAIARAILKNPSILLLDEATSALDAESEKTVQNALDRMMKSRTTVVVAHRLSTIRNADVIAVIDDGKVVEQGSHKHLLHHYPDGHYARMIELQRFNHSASISASASASTS
ncbi:hypothetical protein SUGI_0847490 [Cryptomeria japonica]|uniref:ABC transporter B family member 1 n=1 Tax=Cryptomeria japonica TaxID=3369 RepID=UPI002414A4B9|nr:ABC transporter B family member 1 [Cryptomeria japonica]GLJ40952.1 hypothetical protein SUGI_0847490 [Cryptomeria japonica]